MAWLLVKHDEGLVFEKLTYGEIFDISWSREEKPKRTERYITMEYQKDMKYLQLNNKVERQI